MKWEVLVSIILIILFSELHAHNLPKVSIITSVYNGDEFIKDFMEDITKQTIFDDCELIIINANSPGSEEEVIQEYCRKHNNIKYVKLTHDPGLYAVWNKAIKMSSASYITNANIDDRLKHDCYEIHVKCLDTYPAIDLVYSDFYCTHIPNQTFESNTGVICNWPEFSEKNMKACLPNNHPMWRKSLHDKHGYFDERYKHIGDYEMWLRGVAGGAKFLKIPGVYGLYYYNPNGLSTNRQKSFFIKEEEITILNTYFYLFKD